MHFLVVVLLVGAAVPPGSSPGNGSWLVLAGWIVAAALSAAVAAIVCWRSNLHHQQMQNQLAVIAFDRDRLQNRLQQRQQIERQLQQAKQSAELAARAKDELLTTLGYQIRAPLHGIVPMLDLLQANARLPPDQGDILGAAQTSSQQLLCVVDDIIDYARLEANTLQLKTVTFNLRDLVEAVVQQMQGEAQRKGLKLGLKMDPALDLPVRGDPVRLRQLLVSLIDNSIKFTPRGSVVLSVDRLEESALQHLLRFEVQDTGIGFSIETQSRLFDPISRSNAPAAARPHVGTGLGLAICKRVVSLKGGRIGATSKVGQGSTFWFKIPLLKPIDNRALPGA
jgi:signal transduction histidine kinase